MRIALPAAFLLVSCVACGGGSGGTVPPDDTPPSEATLIEGVLGACDASDVEQTLNLQELLLDLFGPSASTPDFSITGFNLIQASFSWSLDQDGDDEADLLGSTQFRDANGVPTIPIASPQDLADALGGDLTALAQVIALMPAGTQIVTTYSGSPAGLVETTVDGAVTLVIGEGGTLARTSGSYASQTATACTSAIDWIDLDVGDVAVGERPTGTLDIEATSATSSIDGTLTLDGSDTAVLDASIDGGPPATYTLDLTTGAVSPAP